MAKIYIFAFLMICIGGCLGIPPSEVKKHDLPSEPAQNPLLVIGEVPNAEVQRQSDGWAEIEADDAPISRSKNDEELDHTDDDPEEPESLNTAASGWHGGYGGYGRGHFGGGWGGYGRRWGGYGGYGGYGGWGRRYGGYGGYGGGWGRGW